MGAEQASQLLYLSELDAKTLQFGVDSDAATSRWVSVRVTAVPKSRIVLAWDSAILAPVCAAWLLPCLLATAFALQIIFRRRRWCAGPADDLISHLLTSDAMRDV